MMLPTALYFKDHHPGLVFFFMLVELVFGTLLVCASLCFYILSIQVTGIQSQINLQQHNLAIFREQITRLFAILKRRD